ncbi:hypothetical protein NA57DRAFT_53857 [Rhizodiscina lignyota]|uniref:DUF3824 domain-containing protein n=1 Tax=Rhizodiscina lignyota TaxID=1504668 RepID=A0A9P4IL18_9PEZI|nr:hypothetical protein NA57DRAFT_53857 [Rhizodiscina lignyota]
MVEASSVPIRMHERLDTCGSFHGARGDSDCAFTAGSAFEAAMTRYRTCVVTGSCGIKLVEARRKAEDTTSQMHAAQHDSYIFETSDASSMIGGYGHSRHGLIKVGLTGRRDASQLAALSPFRSGRCSVAAAAAGGEGREEGSRQRDYLIRRCNTPHTLCKCLLLVTVSLPFAAAQQAPSTMSSYVVKEREREWDTESVRSGRSPQHYTTVRRYKVPERSTASDRTVIDYQDDGHGDEEVRIVRREREVERAPEREDRDIVSYRIVEREREQSPRREERRIKIVREESRSPSPVREREFRYERDDRYDRLSSHSHRPYDLEKYSKSTEYFSRPEPQPIIIRETVPQPIIIQEPRQQEVVVRREFEPDRVDKVDLVERTEIDERSAIVPAQPPPPQEDYYYERVTREVDRPRRRYQEEDRDRGRRDKEDERAYSDDDVLYVRRETVDDRDESPHTKRHLAEGAIAGLGAAALMRHHRKRQGEEPGHRGRQALGYAAAGAVGAEALSRARKAWDHRSRSRSLEEFFDDRDGRRDGGRRRKSSSHRNRNTALAVAGIAALGAAAYAAGKRNNNTTTIVEKEPRRSRSRHRRHSVSGASDRSRSASAGSEKHVDPNHRNRRIAQAGLAGAALAGLAEHRSRSRGGRSKSRVRQGVPIVAAGLGSAAVAGLYEKFKGNQERKRSQSRAKERGHVERELSRSRSRSVSRDRSRSRSVGYSAPRAGAEAGLIEYGADPLYTSDQGRRRSRSRGRSRSSSGSDRRHHHGSRSRSHSRGAQLATAAAAAGVTGLAMNEARKRRERKKEEKERRRREEEGSQPHDEYIDPMQYYPATNQFPPPPPPSAPSPYPPGAYNAPPPVQGISANPNASFDSAYHTQPYNPADYPPQAGPTMPGPEQYYQQARDPGMHSPAQEYYGNPGAPTPGPPNQGGYPHNPENVSVADFAPASEHSHAVSGGCLSGNPWVNPSERALLTRSVASDGITEPYPPPQEPHTIPTLVPPAPTDSTRSPSPIPTGASTPKSVKFDLPDSSTEQTPRSHSDDRHHSHSHSHKSDSHHRRNSEPEASSSRHHRSRSDSAHDYRSSRPRRRDGSPDSQDSGETIDLPPRFDQHGRKRAGAGGEAVDPLAAAVEDFLAGRKSAGKIFQRVAEDLLVPSGSRESSSPRRRR